MSALGGLASESADEPQSDETRSLSRGLDHGGQACGLTWPLCLDTT